MCVNQSISQFTYIAARRLDKTVIQIIYITYHFNEANGFFSFFWTLSTYAAAYVQNIAHPIVY